jgi:prepilin-type N-terminal cleavage/methylation domain-containing protein
MNRTTTIRSVARSAGTFFGICAPTEADSPCDDEGFTLAEVIVSIALFTVMSVAATTSLVTVVKLTNRTENRVLAANLAREQVENLRLANTTSAAVLDEGSHDVQLKNKTFTVTTTLDPVAAATCTAGSSRRTTVTVWAAGQQLVRYDAVLAC